MARQLNDLLKILKEIDANQKTYSQLKMSENEIKMISEKNSNNLSVKEIQKGSSSNRRKRIQKKHTIGMQKESHGKNHIYQYIDQD